MSELLGSEATCDHIKGQSQTVSLELPNGWGTFRFSDVITNITNGLNGKQDKSGIGIAVSRIETIAHQKIDFNRVGYLAQYDPDKIGRYKLNKGDNYIHCCLNPFPASESCRFLDDLKKVWKNLPDQQTKRY